ncbi:twin-arginine translocation signal domain-containing protein [Sneathiella marina]|uniref:Twin-arginine translocation signal domain-containing protein n=1 Tax=Sneathiella marina TaxID=2950108 RepID=A0ABY4W126_9PROT|nr:twin-arginine translocation signal domain-containing protein [Sneathiella marina]USG60554.1 twin-arginine translocation signal domain-containing protein [Sneathiella marina]
MKRQTRQKRRSKNTNAGSSAQTTAPKKKLTRRDFLGKIGYGTLGVAVAGGGSWFFVEEVRATMRESDLSQIGNGIPTVVQIHDPQCSQCVALQRESREALCEINGDQLQFLVADIRTSKGRRFAATHNVSHVTLLLFDADGQRRNVLVGPNKSEHLSGIFQRHLARYAKS